MIRRLRERARAAAAGFGKPLLVFFGLIFFLQVGTGMVWSMLAVYGHSIGASAAMVGTMVSSFGGARMLANFPAGWGSEKFGRRRMMALGCGLLAVASFFAAATTGIPAILACLLLMGIGSSVFITSALAAAVDLGRPERRMRDMAAYQGANIIGISMGPALGGLVAGLWGYGSPFVVQGTLAVVTVLALPFIPWTPYAAPQSRLGAAAAGRPKGFVRQAAGIGLMAFSLFYVRVSSNWILLPLIGLDQFGMDVATVGLVLTAGAVTNLLCLPVTAWAAVRLGRARLILLSSALTLAGAALLAFGKAEIFVWLTSILFGAGGGLSAPTLTAYVADAAPADRRGPAMGLLRTMQDAALILGPLATGLLTEHLGLGYQGGLFGAILLLAAATAAFGWVTRRPAA